MTFLPTSFYYIKSSRLVIITNRVTATALHHRRTIPMPGRPVSLGFDKSNPMLSNNAPRLWRCARKMLPAKTIVLILSELDDLAAVECGESMKAVAMPTMKSLWYGLEGGECLKCEECLL